MESLLPGSRVVFAIEVLAPDGAVLAGRGPVEPEIVHAGRPRACGQKLTLGKTSTIVCVYSNTQLSLEVKDSEGLLR